ncbi:uncharacterized protein LOC128282038 [Gossypium arboreum]|uniref:uncharacterized protein LOC128282038 n=1 Tax=Gossypium arboreum TaxID=29729 RepID=UPI0022F14718|nr:uncharacterized protein LOC128282038 [Gossypium arboreum]
MDQKRKEFFDLKHGRITVTEYEREFVRLSKYAQECVSFEAKMCRRFEDGLNEDIRLSLGVLELKEFIVLVDRAFKVEELIKGKKKTKAKTRDVRKRHASKKQDLDFKSQATSVANVDNVRSSKLECQHFGRNLFGKCRMNDGSYFRCGSQDHFIKDCPEMTDKEKFQSTRPSGINFKGKPQKNVRVGAGSMNVTRDTTVKSKARAPARTYAIRAREDASSPDVITNTFSLYDNTVIALVDPGSTYSYVCMKLVLSTNMPESELKVDSVSVVSEYVDLFLEELPGLPPNRDVKFGIELMLGTTPISVAPYRIAPIELKELKSQLLE